MLKSAVIATTFAITVSAGTLKTKPGGEVWDEETCVSRLWLHSFAHTRGKRVV